MLSTKSKEFIEYLFSFDYSTIEHYLKEQISLMEFEKNNEYLEFIYVINYKKHQKNIKD